MTTVLKLPRIVELVRVSTTEQKDKATHEAQAHALDALRKARPGVLVKRLQALGVSGAKGVADRDDLQELRRLSVAKAYDELRVFSVDRLTRSDDPRERAAIYGMVLDAEAKIVDCGGRVIDPGKDGDLGELDYFLQTLFAARERKKIAARTTAGRRLRASQGKLSQGSAPYGRRLNRDTMAWELVPHEAATYRRIIDSALAGISTRAIAKQLNADGVPPARGTEWFHSSIKRLLRMPSMYGEYRPCGHLTLIPPIGTKQEFERIREKLRLQSTCPTGVERREAMMRRRLVCGGCGLTTRVETDDAASYPRYACAKRFERQSPCPDRRTIPVPLADKAVRAALLKLVLDSDAMLRAIKNQRATTRQNPALDAASVAKALAMLDAQQARTLRFLSDGLLTEEGARHELERIKTSRASLEGQLTHADVVEVIPEKRDLMKVAREFGRALRHATIERMGELMGILIPNRNGYGLTLRRDGIEIVGVLPLGAPAWRMDSSLAKTGQAPGRRVASFRLKVAA